MLDLPILLPSRHRFTSLLTESRIEYVVIPDLPVTQKLFLAFLSVFPQSVEVAVGEECEQEHNFCHESASSSCRA